MVVLFWAIILLLPATAIAGPVIDARAVQTQSTRTEPLTIDEVLARIELMHPLLRATGVERMQARAKILKALGAWEPKVHNFTEVDRWQLYNFQQQFQQLTSGYNDTKLEVGHP